MGRMIAWFAFGVALISGIGAARAEPRPRSFRFGIDTELLSVTALAQKDRDTLTWIGLGPSQGGPASLADVPAPIALTFGYALSERFMLSLRTGLGLDWLMREQDGRGGATFTPTATYLPAAVRGLFLAGGPMIHVAGGGGTVVLGGAELGVGKLFYVGDSASFDLGLHGQGLFGSYGYYEERLQHWRLLLRIGVSLWTGQTQRYQTGRSSGK